MNKPNFKAVGRLQSVRHAVAGLAHMVAEERNARIHLAATLVVVFAGWMAGLSPTDWRWIVLAIALVWIIEALNTAIERVCDIVSPGHDPAVGRAKDVAAGAVLVASLAAMVIGTLVFWPYLFALFQG
jgi:diacylglycerol kinase (ATP)